MVVDADKEERILQLIKENRERQKLTGSASNRLTSKKLTVSDDWRARLLTKNITTLARKDAAAIKDQYCLYVRTCARD